MKCKACGFEGDSEKWQKWYFCTEDDSGSTNIDTDCNIILAGEKGEVKKHRVFCRNFLACPDCGILRIDQLTDFDVLG